MSKPFEPFDVRLTPDGLKATIEAYLHMAHAYPPGGVRQMGTAGRLEGLQWLYEGGYASIRFGILSPARLRVTGVEYVHAASDIGRRRTAGRLGARHLTDVVTSLRDFKVRPRGPTDQTEFLYNVFKSIKDEHPEFTYSRVAMAANANDETLGVTEHTVRNTYRGMGVTWKRGERAR